MSHFVFMLTHGDRTVDNAAKIVPPLADTGLRYIGFKDVGADPSRQRELTSLAHDAGFSCGRSTQSTSGAHAHRQAPSGRRFPRRRRTRHGAPRRRARRGDRRGLAAGPCPAATADEPARPAAHPGAGAVPLPAGGRADRRPGRFEGVDERVIAARALEEVSIGDYVLSGGEIAAMAVLDAVVRLLPGVMGNAASVGERKLRRRAARIPAAPRRDRFSRIVRSPRCWFPGDHGRIAAWRQAEALRITRERRPYIFFFFQTLRN